MTRITFLLVAVALIVAGARLGAPSESGQTFGLTAQPEEHRPQLSRYITCPWAPSDGQRRSSYMVAAPSPTGIEISFPELAGIQDRLTAELTGGLVARMDIPGPIGTSSALVELPEAEGAVALVASGEGLLAGDRCLATIPPAWHLPGGSTLEGESLTLRLFNPFTADARVDLWVFSELGTEAGDLEGVTVPAGRTRSVSFDEMMAGRESLAVIVRPVLGAVIPMMILDTGADVAAWPGTGSSDGWEFPVAGVEGLAASLALSNETSLEVTFQVEVFDAAGSQVVPLTGVIEGPGQLRVPLGELPATTFGIRVTGDGPFGATMVARSATAMAATPGTPTNSPTWLLPGPQAGARLHFLNAGVVQLEVVYTPLTANEAGPSGSLYLPPGALESVSISDPEVAGVLVTGDGPFSVGWWAEARGGVMFAGGVPLE